MNDDQVEPRVVCLPQGMWRYLEEAGSYVDDVGDNANNVEKGITAAVGMVLLYTDGKFVKAKPEAENF